MKKKLASLTLVCTALFAQNAIADAIDTSAQTQSIGNPETTRTHRGNHTIGLVNYNASTDTLYDKDTRTDLCFAWVSSRDARVHGQTLAISNVDCTDKVEALIKQRKAGKSTTNATRTSAHIKSIGNPASTKARHGHHTVGLVSYNASKDTLYDKDARTGLCLAWASNRYGRVHGQTLAISNVPCTDKVETLIKQQKMSRSF